MILLILFITITLTVISLITLSNVLLFPRLRPVAQTLTDSPFVSVMIPARNEAGVIQQTIIRLLEQGDTHYEVILLDDNSDDGTGDIARAMVDVDQRLIVINGDPLPDGWMGKNWACHQMAQIARGDILIFTDADVQWSPGALKSLVNQMQKTDADLYTIWPTQHTQTWAERLCVPLMAVVILGYLPIIGTHYIPLNVFGAANGQCMAWRRKAYEQIGGHAVVSDNVLEDVTLARLVKGDGMRLRMADGNQQISCRMYTDWAGVRDGYAKNILAGYGGSVFALLLATIFHILLFIFPWVWLIIGWAMPESNNWPMWPLMLIMMGLTIRALSAAFTHQRVQDAIFMPISVLLMTRIAIKAIQWHYTQGGPSWKGRVINRKSTTKATPHG